MKQLTDTHIHLDLIANGCKLSKNLSKIVNGENTHKLSLWNMTVSPSQYLKSSKIYEPHPHVCCGLGLHPYYKANLEQFELLLHSTRLIGEVGLDFSKRSRINKRNQIATFKVIANLCAHKRQCVLSIHAVRSTTYALDILEQSRVFLTCAVIFHWFSGSCNDLHRAIKNGAYFSISQRMLKSKRGREYAKVIPLDKMLLETDYPYKEYEFIQTDDIVNALCSTCTTLASLKQCSETEVYDAITTNSKALTKIIKSPY